MSHLVHLKTFLEVYRAKSISHAATQLAITQPAASLHIQSLETLIGKPLFVRQARGVVPTVVADELATAIAPHLDGIEDKLRSFKLGEMTGGTVHFIAPQDFVHNRLATALSPLLAKNIKLRVQLGNKEKLYERLDSGEVDFAITASLPDERFFTQKLMSERLLLVVHPCWLEKLNPINARHLSHIALIAYDETLPLVRQVWQQLFGEMPTIQADFVVPDLRIVKELVINGTGWTVLPEYHCQEELAKGELVALNPKHTAPSDDIYLVWHKNKRLSAVASYTKDFIVQLAKQGNLV